MHYARMIAALFLHFKKPVMIVEGKMQYLYDERGRRFLDVSHARITTSCVLGLGPVPAAAAAQQVWMEDVA